MRDGAVPGGGQARSVGRSPPPDRVSSGRACTGRSAVHFCPLFDLVGTIPARGGPDLGRGAGGTLAPGCAPPGRQGAVAVPIAAPETPLRVSKNVRFVGADARRHSARWPINAALGCPLRHCRGGCGTVLRVATPAGRPGGGSGACCRAPRRRRRPSCAWTSGSTSTVAAPRARRPAGPLDEIRMVARPICPSVVCPVPYLGIASAEGLPVQIAHGTSPGEMSVPRKANMLRERLANER